MTVYRHKQKGPWWLLLYGSAAALLAVGWLGRMTPGEKAMFLAMGLVMYLLGASFEHLMVEDQGDRLLVRFGPIPLFKRRVRYEDIRDVEKGRTTFWDGWGIHLSLKGGWVWNIWGYDCVVLRLERSTLRIGTDDPDGLAEFLRSRLGPANQ